MKSDSRLSLIDKEPPSEHKKSSGIDKSSSPLNLTLDEFQDINPFSLFDTCLIDHSGRQFACIYERCIEHRNCFKTGRLSNHPEFYELKFHWEDRMLWCNEVFPDILRFIDSSLVSEIPDYRFIFNHRYLRKDGSVSQFMHEGTIAFSDDKNFPFLKLKVFVEIGDFKTDETIVLSIFRNLEHKGYQKIFSKVYGEKLNSVLSQREIEIVKLCHVGLSSKMIAGKLNLSVHTIKNHKRNCMEKTRTHNIAELLHICIQNHWI